VFHPGQFALSHCGISPTEIIGNYQAKYRITEKFQGFVVKSARLFFRSWRDLLVRPGPMRHCTLEQRSILKVVRKYCLQEVQIRKFISLLLQTDLIVANTRRVVEVTDKGPVVDPGPGFSVDDFF
jgi:hypothetical protein